MNMALSGSEKNPFILVFLYLVFNCMQCLKTRQSFTSRATSFFPLGKNPSVFNWSVWQQNKKKENGNTEVPEMSMKITKIVNYTKILLIMKKIF
jgi:hypothetical protein